MNVHTPLKRHQALVSFSKDHHFGLLLVWKIRQGLNKAVNPERISNYVIYIFKQDLEKHFREEEQLLLSKLTICDVMRKRTETDHMAISNLVAVIEEKKDDTALLTQMADVLEEHIRFEERELFNHLQNHISPADLELIQERFSNNSKSIDENWSDVFWSIAK